MPPSYVGAELGDKPRVAGEREVGPCHKPDSPPSSPRGAYALPRLLSPTLGAARLEFRETREPRLQVTPSVECVAGVAK